MRERTQKLEAALTAATDAGWTDEICVEIDSAKRQIAEMAKQIETLEERMNALREEIRVAKHFPVTLRSKSRN